jgi:hypothetical protein
MGKTGELNFLFINIEPPLPALALFPALLSGYPLVRVALRLLVIQYGYIWVSRGGLF